MNKYQFRLLKLADALIEMPKENFTFGTSTYNFVGEPHDMRPIKGATYSALGLAATLPWFRQLGFRFKQIAYNVISVSHFSLSIPKNDGQALSASLETTNKIFGLNQDEHSYLFHSLLRNKAYYCTNPYCSGYCSDRHYDDRNPFFNKCFNPLLSPNRNASADQIADHIKRFVSIKNTDSYEGP